MANYKLSDGRVTDPPVLPLTGAELLFASQIQAGLSETVVISVDEILAGPRADIDALEIAVAGKAPTVHNHTISQVTGLQAELDSKSNVGHTHNYVNRAGDTMTGTLGVPGGMRMSGNLSGAGSGESVFEFTGGKYFSYSYGADEFKVNGAKLTVIGEVRTVGGLAAFFFQDRSSSLLYAWYATSGTARLYNDVHGDIVTVTQQGELRPANGIDTGSSRKLKHDFEPLAYTLDDLMALDITSGRYKPDFNKDQRRRIFFSTESFLDRGITEPVRRASVEYGGEMVDSMQYEQTIPLLAHFLRLAVTELREARAEISDLRARLDAAFGD